MHKCLANAHTHTHRDTCTHTHTPIHRAHFNSDCRRREASSASKWTSGSNCCRLSHTHTHTQAHLGYTHTHTAGGNCRGNQNKMHLKCQRRIEIRNSRAEAEPRLSFLPFFIFGQQSKLQTEPSLKSSQLRVPPPPTPLGRGTAMGSHCKVAVSAHCKCTQSWQLKHTERNSGTSDKNGSERYDIIKIIIIIMMMGREAKRVGCCCGCGSEQENVL